MDSCSCTPTRHFVSELSRVRIEKRDQQAAEVSTRIYGLDIVCLRSEVTQSARSQSMIGQSLLCPLVELSIV